MLIVWLKFIICAAAIFFAGSKLTKYGDAIAEKTGLCRVWIGLTLLAVVTSLPELANAISATAIVKIPDLAVGDILGACMINMFTLALLDLWQWARGQQSIFLAAKESNLLSALFGAAMLLFVAVALGLSRFYFDASVFGVSVYTIIIIIAYFLLQKLLFDHSKDTALFEPEEKYLHLSNSQTYLYFLLAAAIVIAAGSWLPFIGNEIVSVMGWGKTFVAVLFLGLATTLPEATVSISALRLGHLGMSIGNLVGSNIFNIAILFVADIFYQPASLLPAASFNMIYAALFGALFLGIAFLAMKRRVQSRLPSLTIFFLYLLALFFLFRAGVLS
ncbi:sodium:calcium antiporter [Candidatus Margulisiibacteriota bacterium]